MKSQQILIFVCTVASLFSCGSATQEEGLSRSWKIVKVSIVEGNNRQNEAGFSSPGPAQFLEEFTDSLYKDTYLRLYKNGDYAMLSKKGNYTTHTWKYDYQRSMVVLKGESPDTDILLKILESDDNWIQFRIVHDSRLRSRQQINLLCMPEPKYEYEDTDLLTKERNTWRIRPTRRQTRAEIQQRLVSHLAYIVDYFQMIANKKQAYFETALLQSPFRFYQGGLGIAPASDLPEHWTSTYYNREEALIARKLLAEALSNTGDYPRTKSFTEAYKKVIARMKVYLEK